MMSGSKTWPMVNFVISSARAFFLLVLEELLLEERERGEKVSWSECREGVVGGERTVCCVGGVGVEV